MADYVKDNPNPSIPSKFHLIITCDMSMMLKFLGNSFVYFSEEVRGSIAGGEINLGATGLPSMSLQDGLRITSAS